MTSAALELVAALDADPADRVTPLLCLADALDEANIYGHDYRADGIRWMVKLGRAPGAFTTNRRLFWEWLAVWAGGGWVGSSVSRASLVPKWFLRRLPKDGSVVVTMAAVGWNLRGGHEGFGWPSRTAAELAFAAGWAGCTERMRLRLAGEVGRWNGRGGAK